MGVSTVAHPADHASAKRVKERSGFWHSLFARPADDDPQPPVPDEQARWFVGAVHTELQKAVTAIVSAQSQQKDTAASPTDLDGSRPAYLLRRIAMLCLDLEIDPELTFQQAVERLQWAWDMLAERAAQQEAFERHLPGNKAEAEAQGALLFATGRRGTPIGPDSSRGQVAVAEVVDRATKAMELTGQVPKMTPDALARLDAGLPLETPTLVMGPVVETVPAVPRPWDGLVRSDGSYPATSAAEVRPAIPGEPAPSPAPLPRRRRITSFPAAMSANPGVPLDGAQHEAVDLDVIPGAWLLFGALWVLVESVSLDAAAERVLAHLATDEEMSLALDAPVWLLTPGEAVPLASAYRAQVDELEASR